MKKEKTSVCLFFPRNYIYLITLLLSLLLIVSAAFIDRSTVPGSMSGIGCSGIAAAIMAFFIDKIDAKNKAIKLERARQQFLAPLNRELVFLIQRILWFDMQIDNDTFDWNNPPNSYLTPQFSILNSHRYSEEERFSFTDVKKKLQECQEKYTFEALADYSPEKKKRIAKMFRILAISATPIHTYLVSLDQQMFYFDKEEILSIDTSETIIRCASIGLAQMGNLAINHSVLLQQLLIATETLHNSCDFDDCFVISPSCTIGCNELNSFFSQFSH